MVSYRVCITTGLSITTLHIFIDNKFDLVTTIGWEIPVTTTFLSNNNLKIFGSVLKHRVFQISASLPALENMATSWKTKWYTHIYLFLVKKFPAPPKNICIYENHPSSRRSGIRQLTLSPISLSSGLCHCAIGGNEEILLSRWKTDV